MCIVQVGIQFVLGDYLMLVKKNVKVYVDTCILSNLREGKLDENHLSALDKICDMNEVELVTSKKMLEEFLNTKDDKIRIALKVLYKIMAKIPYESLLTYQTSAFNRMGFNRGGFNSMIQGEDYLFTQLKQIFTEADAEHIFQAVKANCEFFLTVDYKTILKKVEQNQRKIGDICPVTKFVDPPKLLMELKACS